MKKICLFIAVIASFFLVKAQCPNSLQLSIKNVAASACPSSGIITIGSNAPFNSLVYTILSGPSGAPVNTPQNDSTFSGLPAGNYTFQAACAIDPTVSNTISATIADNYLPITNVTCNVTSNCGTFTAGGTITTVVAGGKAPLEYSIVNSTNPNYPDSQSSYGTSNSLIVNAFGTYQIRVKDACNQFSTKTVTLSAPPPVYFSPYGTPTGTLNNQPCGSNTFSTNYNLKNALTGNTVDKANYLNPGFKLEVYDGGAGCTQGAKLNSSTILVTAAGSVILPVSPSKKYYFVLTDACGQVSSYCWDGTASTTMGVSYRVDPFGCNTPGSPLTENIWSGDITFANYPVNFVIKNSGGTIVNTVTVFDGNPHQLASGLPQGSYTVSATDACGAVYTKVVGMQSGAPSASYMGSNFECVFGVPESEVGTAPATIHFNGAVMDMGSAVVTILSGPSQVGIAGYKDQNGNYSWMNLLPGNYVFQITTSCGASTVPLTLSFPTVLTRSITAIAISNCSANGTVTGTGLFNGAGVVTYSLLDGNDNVLIADQPGSVFTNLLPGNYKVAMNIAYVCDATRIPTSIISNTVTVTNSTAGPQVVKKFGVICEDGIGNPLGTGSIYLTLAGASPVMLQYKKSIDATWIVYSSNASTTETITGLLPNVTYDIQVVSCGVTAATQVVVGHLAPLSVTNTLNPCAGSSYVLAIPEMPGATYSWVNPAGVVVSNISNYTISNYNASYDGVYTCTVTFNSCVVRTVNVTLNSTMCSLPLPIRLTSFTATNNNCKAQLAWSAVYHNTDKAFVVERSLNGKDFSPIMTMTVQVANGQYNYTDVTDALNHGNVYYRLRLVDMDGTFIYSAVEIVKACSNGQYNGNDLVVVPNTARVGENVSLIYKGMRVSGVYVIFNAAGQEVKRSSNISISDDTGGTIDVSLQGLKAGVYILRFMTNEGKILGYQKLSLY
jgi:hypothetical protein